MCVPSDRYIYTHIYEQIRWQQSNCIIIRWDIHLFMAELLSFPTMVGRGRMGNYPRRSFQISPDSAFLRYNLERKTSFDPLLCWGRQATAGLLFKIYVLFALNWKVKTLSVKCGGVWLNFVCEWATQTLPALLIHKNPLLFSDNQKRLPVKTNGATFEPRLVCCLNELWKHKVLHKCGYKASRKHLREESRWGLLPQNRLIGHGYWCAHSTNNPWHLGKASR